MATVPRKSSMTGPPDGLTEGLASAKDVQHHLLRPTIPRRLATEDDMPYSAKHKQDTRQRILESARRLFNSKGFAEVSIGEIMANAGLTHGGFYRHFNDKSELYAEAVQLVPVRGGAQAVAAAATRRDGQVARAEDRRRLFLARPFRRPRELLPADRAALGRGAQRRCREGGLPGRPGEAAGSPASRPRGTATRASVPCRWSPCASAAWSWRAASTDPALAQ